MTFIGISLLGFVIGQDLTFLSASLPKIRDLSGAGIVPTLWVNYIYLLTLTVALPVMNRLMPQFSRQYSLFGGGILFCIGIWIFPRSHSLEMFLFARVLQGFGASVLIPVMWEWILEFFNKNPDIQTRPFILSITLGLAVGPLIAAASTQSLGSASVNSFILEMAALGTLLCLFVNPRTYTVEKVSLNYLTAISFAVALFFSLFPLTRQGSWGLLSFNSLLCEGIAIAAGVYFVFSELSNLEPIYYLRSFRKIPFISKAVIAVTMGWMTATLLSILMIFATVTMEELPFAIAMSLLGLTIPQFIAFHVLRQFNDWLNLRLQIIICFSGYALTSFFLMVLSPSSSLWFMSVALVPAGISFGVSIKMITEMNTRKAQDYSALSGDSIVLVMLTSIGALMGSAISLAFYQFQEKSFALDKISDAKLILPSNSSGSTTDLMQKILDTGDLTQLSRLIPYHILEKLTPILRAADDYSIRSLTGFLLVVLGIGFAASFLVQFYFGDAD